MANRLLDRLLPTVTATLTAIHTKTETVTLPAETVEYMVMPTRSLSDVLQEIHEEHTPSQFTFMVMFTVVAIVFFSISTRWFGIMERPPGPFDGQPGPKVDFTGTHWQQPAGGKTVAPRQRVAYNCQIDEELSPTEEFKPEEDDEENDSEESDSDEEGSQGKQN
ncbi:hypothetical protein EDC01DRAFT_676781 [Geopyxis carbonaria]|nr:hypothetical protein EDC01DRAFT_676781 [Geopyxis carbonaria]